MPTEAGKVGILPTFYRPSVTGSQVTALQYKGVVKLFYRSSVNSQQDSYLAGLSRHTAQNSHSYTTHNNKIVLKYVIKINNKVSKLIACSMRGKSEKEERETRQDI